MDILLGKNKDIVKKRLYEGLFIFFKKKIIYFLRDDEIERKFQQNLENTNNNENIEIATRNTLFR